MARLNNRKKAKIKIWLVCKHKTTFNLQSEKSIFDYCMQCSRIISLVLDIFLSAAIWNHEMFSNTDMLTAFLFWSDIFLQRKPCIFKDIPKREGSGCFLSLIAPTCNEFQHNTRHWWSFQPNWPKVLFIPMLWSWRTLTRTLHSLRLAWRMGCV